MYEVTPVNVHLVGSIPMTNADEVFSTVARILGDRVLRIPDGETGERSNWVSWQLPLLQAHPALEPDPESSVPQRATAEDGLAVDARKFRFLRVKPGIGGEDFEIEAQYAQYAVASFHTFDQLQQTGGIPPEVRFQVSLPTPYAVASLYMAPSSWPTFLQAYERAVARDVAAISQGIPLQRLAIQWDVCMEVLACEGLLTVPQGNPESFTFEQLRRLCDMVPNEADVGIHLCYGDPGHKHVVEPKDATILTKLANGIAAAVDRKLNWIHMPVPKDRCDDAFFAPLKNLRLPPETELYLGLVHFTDQEEGARQRIAAAARVVPKFGIATECGFGRRPPETVVPLLELHSRIASGG